MEPSAEKKRRELEGRVLEKVGDVIAAVNDASQVDQVIVALYSLAASLFPPDASSFSGCLDEKFRPELEAVEFPSEDERIEWWEIFYKGSAFRAFARFLLYDVASNWLACFPTSARKQSYDVFFVNGCATETVCELVPCLQQVRSGNLDSNDVCSNAERLLVLCFLENNGVLQMVRDFYDGCQFEDLGQEQLKEVISRVSQLIMSIPDKARQGAPTSLAPRLFFKRITAQLFHGMVEWDKKVDEESSFANANQKNSGILFVGEAIARICRRGYTGELLHDVIPLLLGNIHSVLRSSSGVAIDENFVSQPGARFWLKLMEAVKDSHSVERIAEELLHQLAVQNVNDVEGYWFLWILFGRLYKHQSSIRLAFREKFLLWKVFPICCLRWILHFAVLECAPDKTISVKSLSTRGLSETVQRLVAAWSKNVTAALGLCLEKMDKEDLDAAKDALPSILQGISSRLESPEHLVRKMASSIALVFSKIIDPKNPLYLDDSCQEETIDWEFGKAIPIQRPTTATMLKVNENSEGEISHAIIPGKEIQKNEDTRIHKDSIVIKNNVQFNLVDPDEVIDPATLNNDTAFNEDDSDHGTEDSETSSDSLKPYDLTDDDTDLTRKFSQLADVIGALRKSDDAEGVEKALDVTEKLVRASPDELKYMAGDLARTLLMVRCSDLTVEGEEESAEEKRQKALIALIVTCPYESLDSLNKLLYSPNVDIGQRIIILDVMTDAAQELANARVLKSEPRKSLVTQTSDQPWYVPRDGGPPKAGPWKEIPSSGTTLNWSYSYERELPSKTGQSRRGKTRRWSLKSAVQENHTEHSLNRFPQYAAAFMLPAMQGFDKKRHGVDLLRRDFIVLGKLIHMLGVCMKCAAMHPEASVLACPLLDMLRSREVSHHSESYVRRSVLFTASCVLLALHPSFVASALVDGNIEITEGLEWVRTWAVQVAESDTDRECYTLAMACLQLHAEMALQASRALESTKDISKPRSISIFPAGSNGSIKLPF
ncbi:hypothetical protein F511_18771 [Dorcoceras hygrometricum]|uniref:Uncharacterized protein n=1 Tax=Dorcoceras hygrometricum TaxID=472368 RepID=A0A2Z7DFV7_9LAMI|nr:hypothetical protein F511_18771 [Dorcoceras hygrometricum]